MPRPDASILIPYGFRREWDQMLFEHVCRHWQVHFPEWEVLGGNVGEPFNRAASRNAAASRAHTDIFIFCDSDTLFRSAYDIEKAVCQMTEGEGPGWWGCDWYRMLSKPATEWHLNPHRLRFPRNPWEKSMRRPPGGIAICRRGDFDAIGGYDEEFVGWGYEDSAFSTALTALVGPRGLFGDVYHLWHPKSRSERQEQPHITDNQRRYERYQQALSMSGDPLAVPGLISQLREES